MRLISPKANKISEIITAFKNTKKYPKEFLKDLENGLKRSTYFKTGCRDVVDKNLLY